MKQPAFIWLLHCFNNQQQTMETQIKTPVQIIQELLAIYTSRIELVQKCEGKSLATEVAAKFASAKQQSETYTAELMTELSEFGDAVMASVDNQNEYQTMYKNVLPELDAMTSEEAAGTFERLEAALQKMYQTILQTETQLPTSLQDMLTKQAESLK